MKGSHGLQGVWIFVIQDKVSGGQRPILMLTFMMRYAVYLFCRVRRLNPIYLWLHHFIWVTMYHNEDILVIVCSSVNFK